MSLNPFGKGLQVSLADLQDEMNQMFTRLWHTGLSTPPLDGQEWAPHIDLLDEPARYVLTVEAPGLGVEDIEVCYEQGVLSLQGRKASAYTDEQRGALLHHERRYGQFCRRITLPESVNADGITATCRRGVLEVILPKKEPLARKAVKVEVVE